MWKKYVGGMVAGLAAAAVLLAGSWLAPHSAKADATSSSDHTLTVTGTSDLSVAPDTAVVTLGYTINAASADAAQTSGNTTMGNILSAVQGTGISTDQVKTSQYSLQPRYSYDNNTGKQNLDGYNFNQTLQVTLKDLNKVGSVIDAATGAGANVVQGVQFTVADPRAAQVSAIKLAVDDAKAKAQAAATQLGTSVLGVDRVDINTNSGSGPVFYAMAAAPAKAGSAAITPGTVDMSVNVTVTFTLP